MKYLLSSLAPGVHAVAVKDDTSWDVPTYTNLYIIKRREHIILIDSGLQSYTGSLSAALAEVGIAAEDVTHVLLTHGHRDHVEGCRMFTRAQKFIHPADRGLLGPSLAAAFLPYSPVQQDFHFTVAGISDLQVIFVNSHSAGSVVIYDQVSRALFAGDFFCFFGEELPEAELVAYCESSRQDSYRYVAEQAAAGDPAFASFMAGLNRLLAYHPEFFCTGHGVVLSGHIHEFLQTLWESGKKAWR